MDFKSVDRDKLAKAFAVAHRSQSDTRLDSAARARMRVIAKLLWDACGEPVSYATALPGDVEAKLAEVMAIALLPRAR